MTLPFTHEQFLNAFGEYNESLWPFAATLWLLTAVAFLWLLYGTAEHSRSLAVLLIVHWLWAGVAYHAWFFSSINPAARLFSILFVSEAALLAWHEAGQGGLRFSRRPSWRLTTGRVLVGYALIYPLLVWIGGLVYPRMPTFGVPCPTAILTLGFLTAGVPPAPFAVAAIPLIWAAIGGSAAFTLGVPADLLLLLAGALLLTLYAADAVLRRQPS
jgi:uncharacterized protein DUF6064